MTKMQELTNSVMGYEQPKWNYFVYEMSFIVIVMKILYLKSIFIKFQRWEKWC